MTRSPRIRCKSIPYRQGIVEVVPAIHPGCVNLETWQISADWEEPSPARGDLEIPESAVEANTEIELTPSEARALARSLLDAADVAELPRIEIDGLQHLTTALGFSKVAGEHLLLHVDGAPLDRLLHRLAPGRDLEGLIPTLLGCDDPAEASVIEARRIPAPGMLCRLPVLMCPDDCDLTCTTVIVEAVGTEDTVEWRRFGLDLTPWHADRDHVGESVEWFEDVGPFRFPRGDYEAAVRAFEEHEPTSQREGL